MDSKSYNRIAYIDVLRLISIIAVVITHLSAMLVIEYPETNDIVFKTAGPINGIGRFCLPLFVMLSGALLLDENKEFDTARFYKTHLLQMIKLLVGWLIFYGIFYAVIIPVLLNKPVSFDAFIGYILTWQGSDCPHLWYLFLVVGIYLSLPVFRLIAKDKNKALVLGIIAAAFIFKYIPKGLNIITDFYGSKISAAKMIDRFYLDQLAGPTGLLLLGWYLAKYPIKKSVRICLYIWGIIAEITGILFTQVFMDKIPSIRAYTYDYISIFAVIVATALFVFLKHLLADSKSGKTLAMFGKLGMGIYVLHVMFIDLFYQVILHYDTSLMHPIAYIFIFGAFVFGLSIAVAYILSKTKVTAKWIYFH